MVTEPHHSKRQQERILIATGVSKFCPTNEHIMDDIVRNYERLTAFNITDNDVNIVLR